MLDPICLELMRVSGAENFVAGNLGSDDLDDDIAVRESNDETVLWCIVLILGLGDETLSRIVIGLSGPTALVFGLVPAAKRNQLL